ncbi:putative Rpc11-DNA-directed RNA polymerase III subunit C11 [Catenaria anguillulae PL171]|uniref:DNA-directed RNA polymerase subunit n=1 Tax=Catenaria anguillulae PL171 TaxID=765915 RepID=A0A1Y2I216_9FUNG|nr:putative Rpc11-DNA-directed RNA polymerase III subunit C11 [Catenaria anguillulae PL171]
MIFCPQCGNLLILSLGPEGNQRFSCRTCPYVFNIAQEFKHRTNLERKEVDDVLGGEKAWENVAATEAQCPKCEHPRAYFRELQIRSADEPMTVFYKCANMDCQYQWKDR